MEEVKNTQGGKRVGSGRKPTGRQKEYKTVSISCLPYELEQLKALAKEKNKTLSRLVVDTLLTEKN